MITVTRFDNTEFIVNADLIEYVETLPDTHITLVTGKKLSCARRRRRSSPACWTTAARPARCCAAPTPGTTSPPTMRDDQ